MFIIFSWRVKPSSNKFSSYWWINTWIRNFSSRWIQSTDTKGFSRLRAVKLGRCMLRIATLTNTILTRLTKYMRSSCSSRVLIIIMGRCRGKRPLPPTQTQCLLQWVKTAINWRNKTRSALWGKIKSYSQSSSCLFWDSRCQEVLKVFNLILIRSKALSQRIIRNRLHRRQKLKTSLWRPLLIWLAQGLMIFSSTTRIKLRQKLSVSLRHFKSNFRWSS